ncbi:MAG TPA: T9SS type A sorting domain-containing protein [Ignavibacteriaceae bacterium]|nr:T9SS type A sorting domain-containing protein [Ignavibacteriaceae bacterium]
MKSIVIILFCLIGELVIPQISFYPVYNLSNTPNTASGNHSVYFEPGGNYYIVWVDDDKILFKKSTDLGESWSGSQVLVSSNNICGSPAIKSDYNYVYVVCHQFSGDYEILFLSSSDFGQTWSPLQGISGMDSGSLVPQLEVSGSNIFVTWEQKTSLMNNKSEINFIKSSDRGISWSSIINLSNSQQIHSDDVQITLSGNNLYCSWLEYLSSMENDIYFSKSTNNGNNWTAPVNITNNSDFQYNIYMTDNGINYLYIAYENGALLESEIYLKNSSDGGGTWSVPVNITNNPGKSSNPCISIFSDNIYFIWSDNSHSIPANDSSDIFFKWSTDFGLNWLDSVNVSENSGNSLQPRICYEINGPLPAPWLDITIFWYDYSPGISEIFARRANHNLSSVEATPDEINSFILEQNYPNPFNPSTRIKYSVPFVETHRDASLLVTLKVFDILGNEIETLVNEEKAAGAYEITWYAEGLPSGIYFYQLKAGEFIQTMKMILLK